jgi:alpha-mannosidase
MTTKPILYLITNNHFDPTWRRCFDRRFTWNGDTYVSYAEIEAAYLLENLALARQHAEYKFEAESVIVVRKFLERHPEALPELQALAKQGRFAVTGAGDNIIDTNLVHGESIVRNYLYGLLWVEETFGQKTGLAVRNDGFGNSAQLPQILRGVEIPWASGFSYTPVMGRYWRGLDGSTILAQTLPVVAAGGGVIKYPPCPACRGVGCETCNGRGFDDSLRAILPEAPDPASLAGLDAGLVTITPEEYLPNPAVIEWAKNLTDLDVRFALEEDVRPHLQDWLAAVDNPPADLLHPSPELNPNNTGVYASRIQTKQTVRRQEYALFGAETLAAMAALTGSAYPHDAIHRAWQGLHFTMFHDAITATHVDPAYAEIQDFWQQIDAETNAIRQAALAKLVTPAENTLSVLNLTGDKATQLVQAIVPAGCVPTAAPVVETAPAGDGQVAITFVAKDVPPFSAAAYRLEAGSPQTVTALESPAIENERFRVTADGHGLLAVFDKILGQNILQAEGYRPGELVMEHDEGSPWATLHPDQTRTPMSEYTHLVAAERGDGFQRLTFEIEMPWAMCFSSRGGLQGRVTVTLVDGLERIGFQAALNWATFNHRLRVAFPTPMMGKHFYGIPYGMLERQPYEPWFGWTGANGDWPAINWAGVQGEAFSVAVLNKGTPSYRIEHATGGGDVVFVTPLRSPAVPTYLHEPEFYSMTAYDGMRDEGHHTFDLAVTTYEQNFATSRVAADAEGFNAGLLAVAGQAQLPALPRLQANHVRVGCIKWAEIGNALIVRLVEVRGQPGEAVIELPSGVTSAAKVNLLERQEEPLPVVDGRVRLTLRAWEIATLRFG